MRRAICGEVSKRPLVMVPRKARGSEVPHGPPALFLSRALALRRGRGPDEVYDELVGALLDVQDGLSARAPAGAPCRPEDVPLMRRICAALEKIANT